jgi:lipid-A-disaccharide synthase
MPQSTHLFLFAGEPSGDLHGSHLLKNLYQQIPQLSVDGVGGPLMRSEKMDCILPMEEFCVMGFTDVFKKLPALWRHFHLIKKHILTSKPDGVILVDYPGFNLRLGKALRKAGYRGKMIQYVSPTVWAHGKHRADALAASFDLLMTIYPFEEVHYSHTSLKVKYIGNPIQEYLKSYDYAQDWRQKSGIPAKEPLIALFPGSRAKEIQRHLPSMLQTASLLKDAVRFAVSAEEDDALRSLCKGYGLILGKDIFCVPREYRYDLMQASISAIAKSGTVTLELALHSCPTVVIYHLTSLNRFLAKYFLKLKLPHYCIVNILAGKEVFPELIEQGFTPKAIAEKLKGMMFERKEILEECEKISQALQSFKASEQAAAAIKELLWT